MKKNGKTKRFIYLHILTSNSGLETEGIFRVSGNMKRVNALEFQFDQGASHYGLDFNWNGYTVHDAANLLTRYLNKLPEPVIPTEYYLAFRDVMSKEAKESLFIEYVYSHTYFAL